jgi:hypothetical protein
MSWGTCYSGSNNIHFDFPPLMSDGRNYASWLPGDQINNQIRQQNDITSNWDYRQYLVKNAENIMQQNSVSACDQCCACPARYGADQTIPQNNNPFLYKSCMENTQPFGYQSSDLKKMYLDDYQLQARLSAPILSQYEYLNGQYANYN